MHNCFYRTWKGIAAVALLGAAVVVATAQEARAQTAGTQPAAQAKKVKDQGEFDIYNEASKDLVAKNYTKALTDLDTWKQKYPESDYKDERAVMYVQAYNGAGQPAKAVDAAGELLSKDLDATFPDSKTGPGQVINVLFTTCVAIRQIPNPTPEELAIGDKGARKLSNYDRKPEGVSDTDWANARTQLQTAAKGALVYVAMAPGNMAMARKPQDCQGAEAAYTKALQDYPDSALIAYQLATALRCQQKDKPEKLPMAVYEFIRAAVVDPTLGGSVDPKKIQTYADNAYVQIHGSDEGLQPLKDQVKQSPLPPPGFTIKTATQIAAEKEAEFEKTNPQLALWMKIKGALADTNGEQYFASTLKDSGVPKLKGTVMEGKPACRSKELLVGIPEPNQQGTTRSEITLKLDAPLNSKPVPGAEIQWEGVPTAFTKDPFMLTMETEKAKIEGLKTEACAAPPAKKGAPAKKGGAARKKK